eukprot:TRINITY_DN12092_c0_g3_i1.p1 TRINITY_DN12092_c0_g3~~TRINITY_DN12092_c0_g3_i1.p1  ORF type:complete len:377 (+),score=73.46 TRINITY_DN12092_c0_g3_i1:50-1180(+)
MAFAKALALMFSAYRLVFVVIFCLRQAAGIVYDDQSSYYSLQQRQPHSYQQQQPLQSAPSLVGGMQLMQHESQHRNPVPMPYEGNTEPLTNIVRDMVTKQRIEQTKQNQLLDSLAAQLGESKHEAASAQSLLETQSNVKAVSSHLAELAEGVAKIAELARSSAEREDQLERMVHEVVQQNVQHQQFEQSDRNNLNAMLAQQQTALQQATWNQARLAEVANQGHAQAAQADLQSANMRQAMTETARLMGHIASLAQPSQLSPPAGWQPQTFALPQQPQSLQQQQQQTQQQLLQQMELQQLQTAQAPAYGQLSVPPASAWAPHLQPQASSLQVSVPPPGIDLRGSMYLQPAPQELEATQVPPAVAPNGGYFTKFFGLR